jgi:peptide deformylase
MKAYQPRLLSLSAYQDAVLHTPTQLIKFPLSIEDQQLIADMVYSIQAKQLKKAKAPWDSAAGMAANQWGISKSIFLYCPNGDSEENLEVIINPSYEPIESDNSVIEEDLAWEGCFSIPLQTGLVKRFCGIRAKYQNEAGKWITRDLFGWEARVYQHETDHLMGHLFDDPKTKRCVEKKIFSSKEEQVNFRKSE